MGSTLLQALNTTFGADIMPDNVSECHVRIYEEIAIPYWKEHKMRGKKFQVERLQAICLVENNISHTKDSLQEDFLHWQYFSDTNTKHQTAIIAPVEKVLNKIDMGFDYHPTTHELKRLYKELLPFQDM